MKYFIQIHKLTRRHFYESWSIFLCYTIITPPQQIPNTTNRPEFRVENYAQIISNIEKKFRDIPTNQSYERWEIYDGYFEIWMTFHPRQHPPSWIQCKHSISTEKKHKNLVDGLCVDIYKRNIGDSMRIYLIIGLYQRKFKSEFEFFFSFSSFVRLFVQMFYFFVFCHSHTNHHKCVTKFKKHTKKPHSWFYRIRYVGFGRMDGIICAVGYSWFHNWIF